MLELHFREVCQSWGSPLGTVGAVVAPLGMEREKREAKTVLLIWFLPDAPEVSFTLPGKATARFSLSPGP